MYISAKKKEENVFEYLLYMWQIEDLIRSCQFNIDQIEDKVIKSAPYQASQKMALKNWYIDLMYVMESENLQEKGHMSELNELADQLELLHTKLLSVFQNKSYQQAYEKALPHIKELKTKSNDLLVHDIGTCLEFVYGSLLLQLQQKAISEATQEALKSVSFMLYHLAELYKDQKYGFLNLPKVQNN